MPVSGVPISGSFVHLVFEPKIRATVLTLVISACLIFYIAAGIIASVVMAVLLAVAVVLIVALLAVVLKQRKQIQRLAVVPPRHVTAQSVYDDVTAQSIYDDVTAQSIYDDVTDIAERQNIELTENTAYGKFNN